PSGRSIQALGVAPDLVVEQPRRDPVQATEEEEEERPSRSEADLRGSLDNDSVSEDEREIILDELARAEEVAQLREEDYQLAYAIDILRGLNVLSPTQAAE
ncbi:MAG: peptidase S41, partial [Pseudomonadota bacterium]